MRNKPNGISFSLSLSLSLKGPGPHNRKTLSWSFSIPTYWTVRDVGSPEPKPRDLRGKTHTYITQTHTHTKQIHLYIYNTHIHTHIYIPLMHTYASHIHTGTCTHCAHICTHSTHISHSPQTHTRKHTKCHMHMYTHNHTEYAILRLFFYGFHTELLVTINGKDNAKYSYFIFRNIKQLFCILDLLAFKTKCMKSFVTLLTFLLETLGLGTYHHHHHHQHPHIQLHCISKELADGHAAKSRNILMSLSSRAQSSNPDLRASGSGMSAVNIVLSIQWECPSGEGVTGTLPLPQSDKVSWVKRLVLYPREFGENN